MTIISQVIKRVPKAVSALLLICIMCLVRTGCAQSDTTLCISEINAVNPHGGFLWWGQKTDFHIEWEVRIDEQTVTNMIFPTFKILCMGGDDSGEYDTVTVQGIERRGMIKDKDVNRPYQFKVVGYDLNGKDVITSEKCEADTEEPVAVNIGKDDKGITAFLENSLQAFKESSVLSQCAFLLIWAFIPIGCLAWLFKTSRVIRATKVFPRTKEVNMFVDELNVHTQNAFVDPSAQMILKKILRNRATVESYRGEFIPVRIVARLLDRLFRVLHSDRSHYHELPTFNILRIGLGVISQGRDDVREILESRAGTEMENLRKCSFIDLLWGMGVTAPLLGLFGTVTGLSYSFCEVAKLTDVAEIMPQLSSSINEALFTTIWGLIAGILTMLSYYYYNYKLERAYSIWQSLVCDILDNFHLKLPDDEMSNSVSDQP